MTVDWGMLSFNMISFALNYYSSHMNWIMLALFNVVSLVINIRLVMFNLDVIMQPVIPVTFVFATVEHVKCQRWGG